MVNHNRYPALLITLVFGLGFIALSFWRYFSVASGADLSPSTSAFVIWTVAGVLFLPSFGIDLNRLGLAHPLRSSHIGLAVAAVSLLFGLNILLSSALNDITSFETDLSRFDQSLSTNLGVALLIAYSWAFGALGEEVAFRGVLMRALIYSLGETRIAFAASLILQAGIFGVLHLYQGLGGVVLSGVAGLIYGGLVLISRGSLWPAVIAHGLANTLSILLLAYAA